MTSIRKVLCALAITAIPATLAMTATPASATPTITDLNNCSITTPNPDATACAGFYTTNLLSNSPTDTAAQQTALASIGYTFDGDFDALTTAGDVVTSLTGGLLSFNQTLYGITYIGVHFGDAGTGLGDRSVFYEFDFGTTGNTGITLNTAGFSNAALYTTDPTPGVPEPSTWAMMLLGFGAAGVAMRRSRRKTQLMSQLA
jgi:hypothetical protein